MTRRVESLERGALYMVVSAALFALMGAAVKVAAQTLPNTMIVFVRNAVSLLLLLPWLLRRGPAVAATRHLGGHLVRGLAGLAAMSCFFFAIGRMPLADAVLLNYSLPLLLPLVERVWLGEAVPRGLWRALAVGFVGILLVLRPGVGVFHPVALLPIVAAGFAALAQVAIRRLTRTEPVTRIVFHFSLIATVVSAVPVPFTWKSPTPWEWAALAASGLFATIGQLLLTRAYACAPAGRVGPFLYTGVIFSGVLDWLMWDVLPGAPFVFGALLVTLAAILALRLHTRPRSPG